MQMTSIWIQTKGLDKVSPPFEGGVAGMIDYLIFTKVYFPAGVVDLFISSYLYVYE
jgi:hypothetical protein